MKGLPRPPAATLSRTDRYRVLCPGRGLCERTFWDHRRRDEPILSKPDKKWDHSLGARGREDLAPPVTG